MLDGIPFERLGARRETFELVTGRLLNSMEHTFIVETGSAWDTDNWEGQGQSTLIWSAIAKANEKVSVFSFDISEKAIQTAKSQVENVSFFLGDSVGMLSRLPNIVVSRIGLLYLDSFDWHESLNLESAHHHFCEFAAVYSGLPAGALIMVDDCHGQLAGKHWMIDFFFRKINIEPVMRGYQTVWVKPAQISEFFFEQNDNAPEFERVKKIDIIEDLLA